MNGDPVTEAFTAIRRISRLADLDLIQSVLIARRGELTTHPALQRGSAPRRGGTAGSAPLRSLDPAHKRDPVYLEYKSAERDLTAEMLRLGLRQRSAVTGEVRDRFNRALTAWKQAKSRYQVPRGQAPPPAGPSQSRTRAGAQPPTGAALSAPSAGNSP